MNTSLHPVRFGFAQVDITPTTSVEMVGFGRPDNRSRGTLSRLLAQIMLWEGAGERACIVAIDSIGFTVEEANRVRAAIAEKLHLAREKVMLCFSHTHSAVNVGQEEAYFASAITKILEGIDRAIQSLAPIKAVWGHTEAEIGVNRRNKDGVLDKRIGVLKLADAATNKTRAIVLRLSAHANVLTSDNYMISSDFIGVARSELEKRYGCRVIITQGASGNIRPKYQHSQAILMEEHPHEAERMLRDGELGKRIVSESMEALAKMAAEIERAVGGMADSLVPQSVYRLCMFSETQSFAAEVPTTRRAMEIAEEAKREADIDGTGWLREVERLHDEGIKQQIAEIEVQYFVLNDGCLCGIPQEAMCEIAVEIASRVHNPRIYFGGYTNGCSGYLPTQAEYAKGGFEVLWSYMIYYAAHRRVMPLNPETADVLVQSVVAKWNQMSESN